MTKSLDLGCGTQTKNPYNANEVMGIDLYSSSPNIIVADLAIGPIPFADDYFDYVTAYDLIQAIPRVIYAPNLRFSFVELMNEVWRVLKPGGIFLSFTPAYPKEAVFRDPTHVNFITWETFPCYFDDAMRWASMYGFKGQFSFETQDWSGDHHLLSILKKHST